MEISVVQDRLQSIFQDLFDNPDLQITRSTTAADIEDWDSITHIDLIVATEKEFKIKMTTAEVRGLNNVGDFIDHERDSNDHLVGFSGRIAFRAQTGDATASENDACHGAGRCGVACAVGAKPSLPTWGFTQITARARRRSRRI